MRNCLIITIATLLSIGLGQDVKVASGKLSFDGCVWGKYYYLSNRDSNQVETNTNSFARLYGFLGITGTISDYAKVRFYYDLGDTGAPTYDIFMILSHKGYELRVGQFKPPTGIENLTPPPKLDFIDYTTLSKHRTAIGPTRDIGLQIATKQKFGEWAFAIINGNGRNQFKDNNKWKDIVSRLVFTPDSKLGITLGGNIYWGKAGPDSALFTVQRFGAELALILTQLFFKSEIAMIKDSNVTNQGLYLATGYRYENLQPVVRLEFYGKSEFLLAITGGINWFIKGDNIKPMLNYTYTDDKISKAKSHKISAQLQFSF
ncbi:MAG: porin [candidate division WOR-3 bacterium]